MVKISKSEAAWNGFRTVKSNGKQHS